MKLTLFDLGIKGFVLCENVLSLDLSICAVQILVMLSAYFINYVRFVCITYTSSNGKIRKTGIKVT